MFQEATMIEELPSLPRYVLENKEGYTLNESIMDRVSVSPTETPNTSIPAAAIHDTICQWILYHQIQSSG